MKRIFSRALWALGMTVLLAGSAEAQRKNGDVNNDGSVSSVDALAVLNAVVGLAPATGHTPSWGDANCDGQVTSLDAMIILAHTVQLNVDQFCVNKLATATVTVVTVESGTGQVVAGGTLQLSATPRDPNNAPIEGKTATWTTSDATRATVSSAGVVTGVGAGDVTITATVDGKAGSTVVTVLASTGVATMELSPRTTTVLKDSSVTLAAVVRDAAGNPIAGRTITWTVEKSTIVQVSTAGVVKGLALGTSKVYATSQTQKDSATITVTATGATATRTWTGATSTEWGVAGNWSPANIPVATDTVFIPSAPANQPEVKTASVTIAGLVVQTGAKVTLGANELQVTGRADVDGEVLGTGLLTMQGVASRESYVRGKLPNVRIIGTTIIVGATTITGNLEVSPASIFDVNGFLVKVSGNALMRGGLRMRSSLATMDVDGSARFFNDGNTTDAILSAGTLKVAGNFTVVVPGAAVSSFPPSGTHKTILDGAAQQFVRDSGVVVAEFQELDVSNTSGGVVFEAADTARFRVNGRMNVLTGTTISGKGRVNVMQNFSQAAGGGMTLRNLGVARAYTSGAGFKPDTLTVIGSQPMPVGTAYEYQTVVVAGGASLTGVTGVAGSLILGCVTTYSDCTLGSTGMNVNGQKLTVAGDVRQGRLSSGALTMTKTADSVVVKGSLLGPVGLATGATEFTAESWTAGILRVGGEFRARGSGATGSHLVILDGSASQSMRVITGFFFQAFTISNTGGVVMNDTTATAQASLGGRQRKVAVRGDFNITTPVKLTGTGRLDVAGNVQTATGSGVEVAAISIGSTLQAAGSFTPDTAEFNNPGTAQTIQNLPDYNTVLVRGKAAFGGSMTFKGSLIVLSGAELNVESRHVTVTKNLQVDGILRMQDARDTLTVLGDSAIFGARNDPAVKNYATAGVLRVSGKLKSDSTGFYPTGSHKTIFSAKSGSTSVLKTATGVFHNFEVAGQNTATSAASNSITLRNVFIRGAMVATNGATKITMDTLTVDGAATLTQADTITAQAPSATGSPRVTIFKGATTLRNFSASGVGTEVRGALTAVAGAGLTGFILHSGTYTEEGPPAAGSSTTSPPVGLNGAWSVRFVQAPTTTTVNSAFSPVVTVEVLDQAGVRVTGTALVLITNTAALSGPTRVVTVNGVGTFTGLTPTTTGTKSLQVVIRRTDGLVGSATAGYTVNP